MALRRAKIVCTLGPAVDDDGAVHALIDAGMNVARLNFSHGTQAEHAARVARIREQSQKLGRPVAILQDLGGPKIRSGAGGPTELRTGDEIDLVGTGQGDVHTLAVSYPLLANDVHPGDRILLSDGQIQLSVLGISGSRVRCKVEHGGKLRPHIGVNLPSHRLSMQALTDKDRDDLRFGFGLGIDYVGLSFVRRPDEVAALRELCAKSGHPTPIIAKIETSAAVENLEAIIAAADAVMVARGDLGVELPLESVPIVQRRILDLCRTRKRPAIVATEMLQSMVASPLPTRAEASDVAGAVLGGADALMLSAETATGQYPIQACAMMDRLIRAAESSAFFEPRGFDQGESASEAIALAAGELARQVGARLIVALTASGGTARLVSKSRPHAPIVAFSPEPHVLNRLSLLWGVAPLVHAFTNDLESLLADTRSHLKNAGLLAAGDAFVLVYGAPLGARGATNALRVEYA